MSAISFSGSAATAAAQGFPSHPPGPIAHAAAIERRLPDDVPTLEVKAMPALAARLGIPFGFEEVGALRERVSDPFNPSARLSPPIVSVRARPLDGRGLTFRQALNAIVAADRRYEWHDIDGVAVLRPTAAWRDAAHPLLRPVGAERLEGASVADAFDVMRRAIGSSPPGPPWPAGAEGRFSLDFAGGTLFDLLNALARAHGAIYWTLQSDSALILLDRSRAVEAVEPALRLGTGSTAMAVPLTARP